MAKKKSSSKKKTLKNSKVKKKPLPKHHRTKKQVLTHGIGIHLAVYVIIALFLTMIGVPGMITFVVFMVLVWGLFVMSYAYYNQK